ncbi:MULTISPECIES: MaoC family dehydratase [Pseudomonas]|uniref:MaoC family dehydratase n=1 Tax=Pseudomonas saxonica TaxID=2600598 RepID=A0A5C5Q102_9PSED|nr:MULTISPECIES: MaoC family dehydratase [Pseudomonas]MCH4874647.1 MaoC family dehydratase [Pseudomonas sp. TMW22091]TWR86908.1 MaoC family dehydratase [Pseudomonas saxonica]TWR98086.1 MaoC family dehydratase [Pseudomonas saxonica]WRQ75270.1 MaoC family dehydratase [Pseudomonas saxonica]
MSTLFSSAAQLLAAQGQDLGRTDWLELTQERINLFAEATGDHQWIHVDPERAASGPFGACIAHGYLTLALANLFMPQLMQFDNLAMGVNYGSDRLRFPAVVKVGSRVRGHGQIVQVEVLGAALQAVVRISVEIEGSERPGCVVDTISRYTFNPIEQ